MIRVSSTVLVDLRAASKPGRDRRDDHRARGGTRSPRAASSATSIRFATVDDDPPGALAARRCRAGRDDRDQRRRQRPGGDELEDQVGQAERGEERVELAAGAERVADDDDADPAEDPGDEERAGDDQARPGEGARRVTRRVTSRSDGRWPGRPRVGAAIGGPEARRRDVGVDLRRREALVAEQLLDDPQVRAAVEQVRRERVAERVRRDAVRQAGPAAEQVEPVAQAADAERRRRGGSGRSRSGVVARAAWRRREEHRPAVLEVRRERRPRRPARAARSAPCGPCRAPGSRRAAGPATRGPRPPAR